MCEARKEALNLVSGLRIRTMIKRFREEKELTLVKRIQSSSNSRSKSSSFSGYCSKNRSTAFCKGMASLSILYQEFHLVPLSRAIFLPLDIVLHCLFRCGVRPMWVTKL